MSKALVLDIGSYSIRTGYQGDKSPSKKIESYNGCNTANKHFIDFSTGNIVDWDLFEKVLNEYVFSEFKTGKLPDYQKVLLTGSALQSTENKIKLVKLFFDKYNAGYVYVAVGAVLSLYTTGKTNGIVVELGHSASHVYPVVDGYIDAPEGISYKGIKSEIYGHGLNEKIAEYLKNNNKLSNTDDIELKDWTQLKSKVLSLDGGFNDVKSTFSNGSQIQLSKEECSILSKYSLLGSNEMLKGVPSLISKIIQAYDKNTEVRDRLTTIVLTGGCCNIKGIETKLKSDVEKCLNAVYGKDNTLNITVLNQDSQFNNDSSFIGGSILTSLPTLDPMYASRKEYLEKGDKAIFEKVDAKAILDKKNSSK